MAFEFNATTGQLDLVKSVYRKIRRSLPAGSTTTVETIPIANFVSIDYSASLKNDAQAKYKGFKFYVTRTDTDVVDQVYARSHQPLNIEMTTQVVGSDFVLKFKNNETFALELILTRAKL
jgi:hypothetical protein